MKATYQETYLKLLSLYKSTCSGHIGGGISVLPLLYALLSGIFDTKKDIMVFSKGHCVAALYCSLNSAGYISDSELSTFYEDGTKLGAHTPANLLNFIPFATGSLGHGFSLANGLALAKKLKKEPGHIYCFCGDGEWQEGSCWEALNFSVKRGLDNLTVIIDCNNWQGFGSVFDTTGVGCEGLASRISSFGVNVLTCNGQDLLDINSNYLLESNCITPKFILAKTIKGKGLLEYEDTLDSHYIQLNSDLFERVINKMEETSCEKV